MSDIITNTTSTNESKVFNVYVSKSTTAGTALVTRGSLNKTDPTPTVVGLYILEEVGIYPNLGNIDAQEGKLNFASFDGTTWSLISITFSEQRKFGDEFTIDGFIESDGDIIPDASKTRIRTDYILLNRNENLKYLAETNNEYVCAIAFFDENKNFISGISNIESTITEHEILKENFPINAVYYMASTTNFKLPESFVNNSTLFDLFDFMYQNSRKVKNEVIESFQTKLDKQLGKNLFNKNSPNIINGKFLADSGEIYSNVFYIISDYIKVEPNTTYVHSNFNIGGAYCCIYDVNKNFISAFKTNSVTIPSNGSYVRMSGLIAYKDIQQFEKGSVATTYEPYTEYFPLLNVEKKLPYREVEVILPKKLYFVKDKQSCIYFENVLLKNLNDATTLYFDKGIDYNRQSTFNFNSAASNQTLNAQVVRNLKKGALKTITYDVIDSALNNGKTINVLHIGDSFTDIGTWVKECKNLLNAQGVTYNQIGTCGDATFKAEGLSGGTLANTFLNNTAGVARIVQVTGMTTLPSTGYPGAIYKDSNNKEWTIRGGKIDGSGNGHVRVTKFQATESDFSGFPSSGVLTKVSGVGDSEINYTNPINAYFNPFLNHSTGVLDITNYINYWGFSAPNIVAIQFTWNDLSEWAIDSNISSVVAQFKSAADHIHSAYPSAKVIFSVEPYGSINGNNDWNGKKYTVLRFVELLLIQFEDDSNYNSWVKIAPSYAFVDLVNGYGSGVVVTPCERYPSINEVSGGDGVHPSTIGMNQIADCVSQIISNII